MENVMGRRIKANRQRLGLTQDELGAKIGVQKSAIAKYENGRIKYPNPEVISKLAEVFDTTPAYLSCSLRRDLYALDVGVESDARSGAVTLFDLCTLEPLYMYNQYEWADLERANNFRTVWTDLSRAKEKPIPGQRDELSEITELFNSLSDAQKESAKNYLRFLKASEEKK